MKSRKFTIIVDEKTVFIQEEKNSPVYYITSDGLLLTLDELIKSYDESVAFENAFVKEKNA